MDRILHVLRWVRVLLAHRAPGRHRACSAASMPRPPAPVSTPARPRPPLLNAPLFNAPLFADPLFDDEFDMVRPYVLLYQQRQERRRQEQRRRALGLALDGIDVGPRFIHGVEVAAR